jgi:hypothetical protein
MRESDGEKRRGRKFDAFPTKIEVCNLNARLMRLPFGGFEGFCEVLAIRLIKN